MMLESVVALCLAAEPTRCREALIPAPPGAACPVALAAPPPGHVAQDAPRCAEPGPALAMAEIAPGVWVHRGAVAVEGPESGGDLSNLGFVIGDRSVALFDSGGARALGEAAWRALRAITDLPVSHVILSHMHPDHIYGARVFVEAGAQVVGHAALARAIRDRAASYAAGYGAALGEGFIGSAAPGVDIAVEDRLEIDLGGRVLALRAWPHAHSVADLTAVDVETGVLFAGDLIFSRHIPALDGSLRGWRAVIDALGDDPPALVVPGHGGPVLSWEQASQPMRRYLGALERDIRAAIRAGTPLSRATEGAAAEERAQWRLFDAFNPRNATAAYAELEWE